ncbi:MAG: hypothetical protein MJ089_03630 [Ruminococcus sp.]|nr:hypothetical protein [Ruminococcus sp.]
MKTTIKDSFHSKKGVSLVVCIVLSIVLFMTTATFLSIALLQQNDTNAQLNTRQAYVSAKSTLETAKSLFMAQSSYREGDTSSPKINIPAAGDTSYAILYYDAGELKAYNSISLDDIMQQLEVHKQNKTIVGNAYLVIKREDDENCTATAVSVEDKYSVNDSNRQGDLSMNFKVDAKKKFEYAYDSSMKLTVNIPKEGNNPPPPGSGTNFLMAGAQTNYSLLSSYVPNVNGPNGNGLSGQRGYNKRSTVAEYKNFGDGRYYMALNRETGNEIEQKVQINSQFPLIFYSLVFGDTSSERSTYSAYNTGVYFLGDQTKAGGSNNDRFEHVAYWDNNEVYGSVFNCKYVVIDNDMYTKGVGLELGYAGPGNNDVLVYVSKTIHLYKANSDGSDIIGGDTTKEISAGYYKVASGTNIFNDNNAFQGITKEEFENSLGEELNLLNQVMAQKRTMHSAYENGSNCVDILNNNGTFNNESNNSYSPSERVPSSYNSSWDNYDIYCAPSTMPEVTGYYDLYSGKTTGSFNFCWYSIKDAVVKSNVKMSLRSSNIVLTIGADKGEKVGAIPKDNGNNYVGCSSNTSDEGLYNVKPASNLLEAEDDTSEFWVRPYWNQTGCTVTIKSEFRVKFGDTEYTVAPGKYTINNGTGYNLFTDEAKRFFENGGGGSEKVDDADDAEIAWVDSTGKIVYTLTPKEVPDKAVNFTATSGDFYPGATYKAKAIYANFNFPTSAVDANDVIFKADQFSLSAGTHGIQGHSFKVNTLSGNTAISNDKYCYQYTKTIGGSPVVQSGMLIHLTSAVKFKNTSSNKMWSVPKGYYFFTTDDDLNLLDIEVWDADKCAYFPERVAEFETDYYELISSHSDTGTEIFTTENEDEYNRAIANGGYSVDVKEWIEYDFSDSRYF